MAKFGQEEFQNYPINKLADLLPEKLNHMGFYDGTRRGWMDAYEIDRNKLTVMGVNFSDLRTLESTANALGISMYEGYKPTPKGIKIIRDYVAGKFL